MFQLSIDGRETASGLFWKTLRVGTVGTPLTHLPVNWRNHTTQDNGANSTQAAAAAGVGGEIAGVGGEVGVRGCCLSPEDLLATSDFVQGLATQVVVPSMERRILSLNATISSVRKGVRNIVK